MRWTVHGERPLYESEWVSLTLVDVELPDGQRFEHHAVRMGLPAAGVVVHDQQRGVLLIWRHRFIPDTWGWEIPAGRLDAGEEPAAAAAREVLEETGWRPGPLTPLCSFHPVSGMGDKLFHVFSAAGAERVGDPTDVNEAERVEWVPLPRVRELMQSGEIVDGLTITGLLWALTFAHL